MTPKRLTAAAEARLAEYDWPGNIRELSNVMERVALLGDDDEVGEELLELPGVSTQAAMTFGPASDVASLEDVQRDHLLTALEQNHWNISSTATQLGISRNTVRARIERFGLVTRGSRPRRVSRSPKPSVRTWRLLKARRVSPQGQLRSAGTVAGSPFFGPV
jgi:transcriptional regulator of acetoin/glycerol metabolism